ncbi:MAG: SRPBCC family protein [Thiohalomonadaceae bacterium]
MARIRDSIEIPATAETVYAYWMHFEIYPEFLSGIEEVRELGAGRLHWRGRINGQMREWDAEVVETVADTRLVWSGPEHVNDTIVEVRPTEFGTTRLTIEAEIEPSEHTDDAVGYLEEASRRLHLDLERFRERLLYDLPAPHKPPSLPH